MTPRMYKMATSSIQMGSPEEAGRGIADIIKFLLQRIAPEKRGEALSNLRGKIWYLNENEISSKTSPSSASLGQSITFIKTILNGHDPSYIRSVLSNIIQNL